MKSMPVQMKRVALIATLAVASVCGTFLAGSVSAKKTPDGVPPSQETVCAGLSRAAFGLCNAYCEAQDCDVHDRPSCAELRRNFQKVTGSATFPCDAPVCGDGMVGASEQCDPPGSVCSDGTACQSDCTCAAASCVDRVLAAAQQCTTPCGICTGDCNADGQVTIDEIELGCAIAEGQAPLGACVSLDFNGDGQVTFDELVCAACNAFLGCAPPG